MYLKGSGIFADIFKASGMKIFLAMAIILLFAFTGCDNDTVEPPVNQDPGTPERPYPADEATIQEIYVDLQWVCLDPENDHLTYDLYFGTDTSPDLIDTNLSNYIYPIYRNAQYEPLDYNTTYYWKVIATDIEGNVTEGPVWSFSTDVIYLATTFDTQNANKVIVDDRDIIYVADDNYGLRLLGVVDTFEVRNGRDTIDVLMSIDYDSYSVAEFVYDVDISGDYAYLTSYNYLTIINVLTPDAAESISTYEPTPGDQSDRVYGIDVAGNYAYLTIGASLHIVDISDPASPAFTSNLATPGTAREVAVSGNYAYVADVDSGLLVVNISDPANPAAVGGYDTPDSAWGVFVYGNYCYVADGNSGLIILNVSDPANPVLAGSYDTPGFAKDVCANDTYAFIADYWNGGLIILNITDKAAPVPVAAYNSEGGAAGVYARGDYIYLADRWKGLSTFVFQP